MQLILDIDNTLADISHRVHIIEKPEVTQEDFERFLDPELVNQDAPFPNAQKVLPKLINFFDGVRFVTSRQEYLRDTTIAWLFRHYRIDDNDFGSCNGTGKYPLYMRKNGDWGTSSQHKEFVIQILKSGMGSQEKFVFFEDDPYVLSMYSKYGLAVKCPEAWDLLVHTLPEKPEGVFNK